jgi:hypothetical protein
MELKGNFQSFQKYWEGTMELVTFCNVKSFVCSSGNLHKDVSKTPQPKLQCIFTAVFWPKITAA